MTKSGLVGSIAFLAELFACIQMECLQPNKG